MPTLAAVLVIPLPIWAAYAAGAESQARHCSSAADYPLQMVKLYRYTSVKTIFQEGKQINLLQVQAYTDRTVGV